MFTAKIILEKADYISLPAIIRSDPIRLRKEFLEIAINQNERWLFRLKSLQILDQFAQVFGLFTPLEKQTLIAAFEREFPPERLKDVAKMVRHEICGYKEPWLVFSYCATIARLTLNGADDIVNAAREVFKGTPRGHSLEVHLITTEDLKRHAVRFNQIEAG